VIDSKDFAKKPVTEKWEYVHRAMNAISRRETAFSLRRRVNPHHTEEQVEYEKKALLMQQYGELCEIKALYSEFRDDMANTCENEGYTQDKNILERLFTQDVDKALHDIID